MYENLIAFLLGKKDDFTDEDLNEFMEVLALALDVQPEYDSIQKQNIIQNMINTTKISDKEQRLIMSQSIDRILVFDDDLDKGFINKKPLRQRKIKRGNFTSQINKDTEESLKKVENQNTMKKLKSNNEKKDLNLVLEKNSSLNENTIKINNKEKIKKINYEEKKESLSNFKEKNLNSNENFINPFLNMENLDQKESKEDLNRNSNENFINPFLNMENEKLLSNNEFYFEIDELVENNNEGPEYEFIEE